MKHYNLFEGEELVKAARNTVELSILSPKFEKSMVVSQLNKFKEELGLFVSIEYFPTNTLRACMGFPRPNGPISTLLVETALMAAHKDPRFVPISHRELSELVFEVNILSQMQKLEGSESKKLRDIKIGRDGLMIEYGLYSGLLLPIVPIEHKWRKEKFLDEVCIKAGMPKHYWRQENVKLFKFQTQIFKETEPSGKVIEIKL